MTQARSPVLPVSLTSQAELVALAAVLGLIDRNLSERATRERVLADAVA
jgi:hypothetical protein